jgi:hypothetical protein
MGADRRPGVRRDATPKDAQWHTARMPEPVSPPTSLVALRDRREAAIQLLADSFAADLLTIEQFDERIARAHAATRIADLDALIADLQPVAGAQSTALVPLAVEPSLVANKKRVRSLFGSLERHGAWVVPDRLAVSAVFGNAVLDFREARFSAATVEVEARVVFGNLEIIVPPQLAVECDGTAIFGNVESHDSGAVADPERPLVRIRGSIVFGNLEVHTRLLGESEGDARRRRKRERKQLAAGAAARALPARRDK